MGKISRFVEGAICEAYALRKVGMPEIIRPLESRFRKVDSLIEFSVTEISGLGERNALEDWTS